ncbi:efflux transporter outer membrane subunit [Pseudomonas sp.]|uniref:efflux transporter outer membrane subunit n=1 Tax=Pseudomonas sp. TaxID=306 RepID=UPI002FCC8B5E
MRRPFQNLLLALSAALLLGGCVAVGPDYAAPSVTPEYPLSFGETFAGIGPGNVEIEWWRAFDEPALVALIQQALAANHDIAIAAVRLEEARAIVRENRQNFLPSGGPAFGYESFKRSDAETPAGQERHIETYRASVDAAWEIDLFGRVRRSVEAAQAQAGSREALLRGVQASVAATVAATWFELRGLEVELAVVDDISKSQRESLHMVERLISAGSAHEFDRLRAEALLRNVEATAPDLQRRRAATSNALVVLLGEAPQSFRLPETAPETQTLAIRAIGVGNPAGLLARRADIVAAERNLAAATAQIGVETAGLYPEVQVRGSLGLVAGSLDALSDSGAPSNFIAPVIRWSLLDRGRVRARIAASESRSQQALLLYDQTLLRALQETDDAFKGYGAAGDTLQLRLLESAANREAARLARERFSEGEGVYLDVLEAERADFNSRRALAVARTNQRLAVVSIYKALGGGWEVCAQPNQDCSGAGDSKSLSFAKQINARP